MKFLPLMNLVVLIEAYKINNKTTNLKKKKLDYKTGAGKNNKIKKIKKY